MHPQKTNKHSFSDTTINVGDEDLNHLQLKNGKDLNTDLLPVLEATNVLLQEENDGKIRSKSPLWDNETIIITPRTP